MEVLLPSLPLMTHLFSVESIFMELSPNHDTITAEAASLKLQREPHIGFICDALCLAEKLVCLDRFPWLNLVIKKISATCDIAEKGSNQPASTAIIRCPMQYPLFFTYIAQTQKPISRIAQGKGLAY